jgi:UDP-glucose 4-epimerase
LFLHNRVLPKSRILVTGGLGYIGSHACLALIEAGCELAIVDSLVNASRTALERLRELSGAEIAFHALDLRERGALDAVFRQGAFDAVMHFAGLKAVGESVDKPLLYYDNNVGGTLALLEAMQAHGVRRMVFSSSATVYGEPQRLPLTEDHPLRPQSPYGQTKLVIENILADQAAADPQFRYVALRYFNPIGAHASGRIGEDPRGIPNNLLPYVAQVAVGRLPQLRVFGADYPTPDGTGMRDFIHVVDLARGHVAALRFLESARACLVANLGTGKAYSVLEVVKAFELACGRRIPLEIVARRPGDVAACYADPTLAHDALGWRATHGIEAMCADAWRWQRANPRGYAEN